MQRIKNGSGDTGDGSIGKWTPDQTSVYENWLKYYSFQGKEYKPDDWGLHLTILLIIMYDRLSIYHLTDELCRDFVEKLKPRMGKQTLSTKQYLYVPNPENVEKTSRRDSKVHPFDTYTQDIMDLSEEGEGGDL